MYIYLHHTSQHYSNIFVRCEIATNNLCTNSLFHAFENSVSLWL
jgi:hypothetical protein